MNLQVRVSDLHLGALSRGGLLVYLLGVLGGGDTGNSQNPGRSIVAALVDVGTTGPTLCFLLSRGMFAPFKGPGEAWHRVASRVSGFRAFGLWASGVQRLCDCGPGVENPKGMHHFFGV